MDQDEAIGREPNVARRVASVRWACIGKPSPAALVVAAAIVAYTVIFGCLTWQQQRNYGTFGFDMGIHDQGIWLLSRFRDPYVTVVGRDYLGHHLNVLDVAYVPFYWLGAGPSFLYLTETVALALGAVPVYLLARDQLGRRWVGAAFAVAYLLHPTIEWVNWWHFHPDALMIAPLLSAWWFALHERWRPFAIWCVIAMMAKEDATTAVMMFGVILVVRLPRGAKRPGLLTVAGGALWFVVATKVLMPLFNHGELAFYENFFPGLGNGMGEIVRNAIRHPSRVYDPLLGRSTSWGARDRDQVVPFRHDVHRYYLRLLVPFSVLCFRRPALLLVGVPMVVINVLSALSYTHDAKFHYSCIPVVAVALATIEGAAALRGQIRWPHTGPVLGVVVMVFALVASVAWSPSPLNGDVYRSGIWARPFFRPVPESTHARDRMLSLVPGRAGVSASYGLLPHLTHRVTAYEFPNPWWVTNWLDCKTSPVPARVDYLVVDRGTLRSVDVAPFDLSTKRLLDELTDPTTGEFVIVGEESGVVVARRVRAASMTFDSPRPNCLRP